SCSDPTGDAGNRCAIKSDISGVSLVDPELVPDPASAEDALLEYLKAAGYFDDGLVESEGWVETLCDANRAILPENVKVTCASLQNRSEDGSLTPIAFTDKQCHETKKFLEDPRCFALLAWRGYEDGKPSTDHMVHLRAMVCSDEIPSDEGGEGEKETSGSVEDISADTASAANPQPHRIVYDDPAYLPGDPLLGLIYPDSPEMRRDPRSTLLELHLTGRYTEVNLLSLFYKCIDPLPDQHILVTEPNPDDRIQR
ncbi:MAG: hypothetical protein KDL87_17190, partial [Verrucomicrobiae bacterium]|nr:hypothetical protein [Verrucomicrobiae bacterium]